jgi:hypothetical protein
MTRFGQGDDLQPRNCRAESVANERRIAANVSLANAVRLAATHSLVDLTLLGTK